ncbi:MAG: hypothetical protein AAF548_00215 [Actinomycetota bacterium]
MFTALRHRLVSLLLVPFLCLSLLASACGSDSADAVENPGAPSAPATEPAADDPDDGGSGEGEREDPTDPQERDDRDEPTAEPVPVDEVIADGPVEIDAPVEWPTEIVVEADGAVLVEDENGLAVFEETAFGELGIPLLDGLDLFLFTQGLEGRVGSDYGRNLAHLDAHLNDDDLYLYVVLEQDNVLEIDHPAFTAEMPRKYSLSGSGRTVVVINPETLYIYVGMECPGANPPVNIDLKISDYQGGCGLGFSPSGSIPVGYAFAGDIHPDFADVRPQLVIDGEVPLPYGDVAGSAFFQLDGTTLTAVATGEVSVGAPGTIGKVIPISLPIGRAQIGTIRTMEPVGTIFDEKTWINGYLGDDIIVDSDLAGAASFVDIAAFLPVDGDVVIDGFLHQRQEPLGSRLWEPDSFLDIEGHGSFSPVAFLSGASGVDHRLIEGTVDLRLDRNGLEGDGTLTVSPIPAVELAGAGAFDVRYLYDEPRNGHLEVEGTLNVGGTDLAEARLRLDRDGVAVTGRLGVGGTFVEVQGTVGPSGVDLRGEAGVTIDLTNLDGLAADIAVEFGEDETIERLEAEIDELAPHATIQKLLNEIDDAYDGIRIREGLIQDQRDTLDDLRDIWDDYTVGQRILHGTAHGIKVAAANTAIAGLNVDIGRLRLVIAGLDGITGLFETLHPDAQPVDVDRFDALKELVRQLKWERFWANVRNVIAGVVRGAGTLLEAVGLDIRIEARVSLAIGTSGVDADVAASVCTADDFCLGIDSSSVDLGGGTACIVVSGGQSCGGIRP